MGFSLEYIDAFIAAVETGSFSAAARRLGKAQSRVSTAIANLEIDLGVLLFDRSGKYPALTPEGESLLREAREIRERCRAFSEHADRLAGGAEPMIRLAVDELLPSSILSDLLEGFSDVFPDTEVELLTGVMGDVGEMVASGRVDAGIELPLTAPGDACDWRLLGHMDFAVMAASHHPLARLEKVTPRDMAPHRQLVTVSRKGEREPEAFRFGRRIWQCESSHVIRELVLKGQGWAALARHQVAEDVRAGRLVELPVVFAGGSFQSDIYFIREKGRPLTPAAEWLADSLSELLTRSFPRA
ncbi:LysR family transcriptional regulator [Desulfoluna butyratoxydans]|uniref:Transcription regulator hth lysr n=1 Tax=Desulfoluna butyratoxydans TaxID=231438 RepID=A0A4U8YQX1_9BACT|nr:LysR family transcriptional regulator [Desulfoluna butyratoxydans]VFQ45847.1 transcription regulator hth lysr [Desulfoluna butyratoxydans]